jgi:hypothetical protein
MIFLCRGRGVEAATACVRTAIFSLRDVTLFLVGVFLGAAGTGGASAAALAAFAWLRALVLSAVGGAVGACVMRNIHIM